jgi:hypothetical protein
LLGNLKTKLAIHRLADQTLLAARRFVFFDFNLKVEARILAALGLR